MKIIPIANTNLTASAVQTYLNEIYDDAGITLNVRIDSVFTDSLFTPSTVFNIPDATYMMKYSAQMRQLRNRYFDTHEQEDDTYYLFVVNALQDTVNNSAVDGYMVRGKSVGFITASTGLQTIAHELGHGIGALSHTWNDNGPEQGSTNNLMDYSAGNTLIKTQWKELRESTENAFWDDEQDQMSAKKGEQIAYYLWKEDENGYIVGNIEMAYKSDYILQDPNDNFVFSYTDLATVEKNTLTKLNQFKTKKENRRSNAFILKNDQKIVTLYRYLKSKTPPKEIPENNWVMYFEVRDGKKKFVKSSNKVILKNEGVNEDISFHCHVVAEIKNDKLLAETVYNFEGKDITIRFIKPRKITIFVNGYRDISNMSASDKPWLVLENPHRSEPTKYDPFNYWKQFDDQIIKKLKSSDTYYLDGHHPAITSNFKNLSNAIPDCYTGPLDGHLIQFINTPPVNAAIETFSYDKWNCGGDPNGNNHSCSYMYDYFHTTSNITGFNERRASGRIDSRHNLMCKIKSSHGRDYSKDTIDIICHSMGYAYALGVLDVLKDSLSSSNYLNFLIIAPENPGAVDPTELINFFNDGKGIENVWHYGSNLGKSNQDPACYQDGIAPQCDIPGYGQDRITIPMNNLPAKGNTPGKCKKSYGESHFIGYYMWIFDIQLNQKGFIINRKK